MRPYLAVIRDSFREAFATKVLWIVLILIALFLGILAPFGYEKAIATKLQFDDFRDPRQFVSVLTKARDDVSSPAGYIWSRLPEDLRGDLQDLTKDSPRRERLETFGRVRGELNELLSERDLYREDVWDGIRLTREGRDFVKKGIDSLEDNELARLNRLALDAAFRDDIEPAGEEAIQFVYLWFPLGDELPLTENQVHEYGGLIIAGLLARLVGNIGVLIAIVVTSWIVPTMLEAGAIDLLLSKPVSRPLLFLSKFAGGCAFIFVSAAFLISGTWLICGSRLGIWNTGLLWTIPVFVFVFAIYYSVSTLAAVFWRNAIVSVIVSVVFWGVCFTMGLTKALMDDVFLNARRTSAVVPARDTLLRTSRAGRGFEWNAETSAWQELPGEQQRGPAGMGPRNMYTGPFYDVTNDRLVAIRRGPPWMRGAPKLVTATRDGDWKLQQTIEVPAGTKTLFVEPDGSLLAVGTSGVSVLKGTPVPEGDNQIDILGFKLPGFGQQASFDRIDDASLTLLSPFAAAYDQQTGRIAILSGTALAVLDRDEGGKFSSTLEVNRESKRQAVLGFSRGRIIEVDDEGLVRIRDSKTLEVITEVKPFGQNEPRTIVSSPDGRFMAVLFHDRRLWMHDTSNDSSSVPSFSGQGSISAIAFGSDDSLYVADRFGRVIQYSDGLGTAEVKRFAPEPDLLESVYTYGVRPLHTIFPKPGEMENVVTWLMTRQKTVAAGESDELDVDRVVINIWEPLWSNLAFLIIMLTVTCVITTRRDF